MAATALPRVAQAAAPVRAHPERARLGTFAVLGMFAGLHWGALIMPAQGGDMILSLLFAIAGALALIAIPADAPDWQRRTAAGAVAFVLLLLALLVAGVPRLDRRVGGRRAAFTVAGCTGYELSGTRRVAEVA